MHFWGLRWRKSESTGTILYIYSNKPGNDYGRLEMTGEKHNTFGTVDDDFSRFHFTLIGVRR